MAYSQIHDECSLETEDEKEEPHSWPPRTEPCLLNYKNLFGITFFLWTTTMVALVWVSLQKAEISGNHEASVLPFSKVPSHIVTFNPDARFHYTAPDTGQSAWAGLMPNDGGILSIKEPRKYKLSESYKNSNDSSAEVYSMSMYHQLHCLDSIRIELGILEGYIDKTEAMKHHGKRKVVAQETHVEHCFDYLRQAIMCAGDLSLEHSITPDDFAFSGWGTAHKCADWQIMWDIAMERRYDTAHP